MIIGISGKIGSGKDTVGNIIQYLTSVYLKGFYEGERRYSLEQYNKQNTPTNISPFKIKKFADALKDIVCILIGCTREQLEDREFKEKELGPEWDKWLLTDNDPDNFYQVYYSTEIEAINSIKEDGDNWLAYNPTIEKIKMTPRLLLQILGTECGRNIIHPNIWVNALMNEYKCDINLGFNVKWDEPLLENHVYKDSDGNEHIAKYPNWIITDMRFPNELKSVKDRGGISIRVSRKFEIIAEHQCFQENSYKQEKAIYLTNEHPSETALDNAKFDYTVDNNGTIEELIEKVKEILIKENIL